MFEGFYYLILFIIGGGMLLIGLIALGYGLYGMSVNGFDKSVRNFSLALGVILVGTVSFFYFKSKNIDNQESLKFVGHYESSNSKKLRIELKQDGTFIADSLLLQVTKGRWQLIDFDEFYKINLLSNDEITLKSMDIIEVNGFCKLRTDDHFTNVEDQLELIKM